MLYIKQMQNCLRMLLKLWTFYDADILDSFLLISLLWVTDVVCIPGGAQHDQPVGQRILTARIAGTAKNSFFPF